MRDTTDDEIANYQLSREYHAIIAQAEPQADESTALRAIMHETYYWTGSAYPRAEERDRIVEAVEADRGKLKPKYGQED